MDIASSGRQTSQSSIRLIKIMECLANSGTPMRLRDIAKFVVQRSQPFFVISMPWKMLNMYIKTRNIALCAATDLCPK